MKTELTDNLVVKSNELIRASYAMTVNEQRLLLACISQIDSRFTLDNGAKFTLSVEQARDLFYTEKNAQNAYRDLQDASERLFERKVRISLPDNKELLTRFVQSVLFDADSGQVTLHFATEIIPYLSQLEQNFTRYRLQNVVQLTSSYAIRLYELIVSWAGQNCFYKEMEIDELRELLALGDKYQRISQLKERVIDITVNQINESTDFNVDIAFRKSRRTFKWVQLRFNRKQAAAAVEAARVHTRDKKALELEHQRQAKRREKWAREFAAFSEQVKITVGMRFWCEKLQRSFVFGAEEWIDDQELIDTYRGKYGLPSNAYRFFEAEIKALLFAKEFTLGAT